MIKARSGPRGGTLVEFYDVTIPIEKSTLVGFSASANIYTKVTTT
jgi:hypothetical protein